MDDRASPPRHSVNEVEAGKEGRYFRKVATHFCNDGHYDPANSWSNWCGQFANSAIQSLQLSRGKRTTPTPVQFSHGHCTCYDVNAVIMCVLDRQNDFQTDKVEEIEGSKTLNTIQEQSNQEAFGQYRN